MKPNLSLSLAAVTVALLGAGPGDTASLSSPADARAIIERAHEVGAYVVLDTYQSAGTVPFDVTDLNVDFATGGSVKWLCGGPGAGWPRRRR